MTEYIFEPLPMRHRMLVPVSINQYNIVAVSGEKASVEATTAYEAFKLSGFKQAIKIERLSSIRPILLSKEKFADNMPQQGSSDINPEDNDDLFAHIKLRKHPIISADEMDKLMHGLEVENTISEQYINSDILSEHREVNPSGLDVQGDGFDEIIPASMPAKNLAISNAEPKETSKEESEPVITSVPQPKAAEKELSEEEIAKLLNEK